jgi:hypothetical protein
MGAEDVHGGRGCTWGQRMWMGAEDVHWGRGCAFGQRMCMGIEDVHGDRGFAWGCMGICMGLTAHVHGLDGGVALAACA